MKPDSDLNPDEQSIVSDLPDTPSALKGDVEQASVAAAAEPSGSDVPDAPSAPKAEEGPASITVAVEPSVSDAPDASSAPEVDPGETVAAAAELLTEAEVEEILHTLMTMGIFHGFLTAAKFEQVYQTLRGTHHFSIPIDMRYRVTPDGSGLVAGDYTLRAIHKQWCVGDYGQIGHYFPDFIAFQDMGFDLSSNVGGLIEYVRCAPGNVGKANVGFLKVNDDLWTLIYQVHAIAGRNQA
ncbi:hypothetical protein PSHT_16070 [Puccinia striiformis]|uniref:Uncharacterized protein n=2 Tax=Puccinia striiformis TaxID=27350 RepID=A0A0L0V4Z9_9BASI|nr:hypothetical protein KEM48_003472 [Puccinia striiformis f. sp. tritici PST-130]KNE94353.1 hypothetical protein PSTG_12255 [Puccinia striiformis f. sp. tritici PST-78]POV94696.1 hypothetical protein PSHT_16070 [Puccinia striiformis]